MLEKLPVVDAKGLPGELKRLLKPGAIVVDSAGIERMRPTHFYRIDSWETARNLEIAPFMSLWEFISVDVREHPVVRGWPRYVPCAVTVLAAHLSALRQHFGTYLHVAANGGYRSPAHGRATESTPHSWCTAADIYRVGDDFLEDQQSIERYNERIAAVMPAVHCSPYGHGPGEVDDHVHIDLGYLVVVP